METDEGFDARMDLIDLVREERAAKQRLDDASAAYSEARDLVLDQMKLIGKKTLTLGREDGTVLKITVVAPERSSIDEAGLRKALGAKVFDKLCSKPRLDKTKLDEAVRMGTIDVGVLAQYYTVAPVAQSLRISEAFDGD